jgi:hypothetical protein
MRSFIVASASMKWFTVDPVPTPTTVSGTTCSSAARATSAFSSFCVMSTNVR